MPTAYSYLRFSSPAQATGDSIRRQTEVREKWLAEHPKVSLDASLKMTDAGRSGFKRKNWDTYALAQFVAHIKSGRVEAGSYLLVENLDRLSREDAGEATELFLSIVNKGTIIVQLSPVVMEFKKPVDMMSLMFAIVELSRGHSESAMKSERSGKAWANKQKNAGSKKVCRRLPGWIRAVGGEGKEMRDTAPGEVRFELIPEAAAVVRRMYQMAISGQGAFAIAKTLNAERVPRIGHRKKQEKAAPWDSATIYHIITTHAALGEYVPYHRKGRKTADEVVIRNYYPAVVDEAIYYAAQKAIETRNRVGRGRKGSHVNLFAGLLTDARDGGSITYHHKKPFPSLLPTIAVSGFGKHTSFRADVFETEVLRLLAELKAADIIHETDATRNVKTLSGEAEKTAALIRAWEAKMDDISIVDRVAAKLAELTATHKTQLEALSVAQRQAASPLSEALGGLKTLADLLASDNSDEMRRKVQSALRRCIEGVYCLFMGSTKVRLAAVRVQFAETDAHRDYLLIHQGAEGISGRPALTDVTHYKWDSPEGERDLRKPDDAAVIEKELAAVDVAKLVAAIRAKNATPAPAKGAGRKRKQTA